MSNLSSADEIATQPSRRGFAGMDPEKQRLIAAAGGRAAHERGTAHEYDSAEAKAAGTKGGRAVSQNRAHMAEIGRRGGSAAWPCIEPGCPLSRATGSRRCAPHGALGGKQ